MLYDDIDEILVGRNDNMFILDKNDTLSSSSDFHVNPKNDCYNSSYNEKYVDTEEDNQSNDETYCCTDDDGCSPEESSPSDSGNTDKHYHEENPTEVTCPIIYDYLRAEFSQTRG